MNALLSSKQDLAKAKLATLTLPQDWRAKRAEQARDWLLAHGLPSKRDHFWSYTDPSKLQGEVGTAQAPKFKTDAPAITPSTSIQNDAVTIQPLILAEFDTFGDIIERAHQKGHRPFAELALIESDGLVLNVSGDAGTFVINHEDWPASSYLRVNLAKAASITLIENISQSAQKSVLIEADLADEAKFDHIRVAPKLEDRLHLQLFADLGEEADLRSFNLVAPSQFRRFESVVNLNGDRGQVSIAGANYLNASSFHDDTVYITHNAEHCTSRQVFKRVAGANAQSIFQGKIYVKEGAQKTDGYQISQGLMLEDGAEVLSKPELEIYADDVVCSHGSTTSGLDETSLFYLRSRGVSLDVAEQLLVRAFIDEAFEEIRDEDLAEQLSSLSEEWIFGQAL